MSPRGVAVPESAQTWKKDGAPSHRGWWEPVLGHGMLWGCLEVGQGHDGELLVIPSDLEKFRFDISCHSFLSAIENSCLLYMGNKNVKEQKEWWWRAWCPAPGGARLA